MVFYMKNSNKLCFNAVAFFIEVHISNIVEIPQNI